MNKFFFFIGLLILFSCSRPQGMRLNLNDGDNITFRVQKAINGAKSGDTIRLSNGKYWIDEIIVFYNKKNIVLDGNNSIVKMLDGVAVENGNGMLQITRSSDLLIKDITFDANRMTRNAREVSSHTLNITNSNKIYLENVNAINNVCDGFYIACYNPSNYNDIPDNITFNNCSALNSFRNGMSIINARNINVFGGTYSQSNGTSPTVGIDVEPNEDTDHPGVENVLIKDVAFSDNDGWGVLVSQKGAPININIKDCIFEDNAGGIKHASIHSTIDNNTIEHCDLGIESLRYGGQKVDQNKILSNKIVNTKIGIKYSGHKGMVDGNIIIDSQESAIFLNGNTSDYTSVTITKNKILGSEGRGVHANNFKMINLVNNTIKDTQEEAAYFTNGTQILKDNEIEDCEKGILTIGSTTRILGNTFDNVKSKVICYKGSSYGRMDGEVTGNVFISNDPKRSNIIDAPASIYVKRNQLKKKK